MKDNKGFTLMELVVVLGILGIIALITVPRFMTVQATTKEDACAENRNRIVEHHYLQYVMDEELDFETYLENIEDYFGGEVVCPSGGEYSLEGNYLVCSEHGKTLVSLLTGEIYCLDFNFNNLSDEDKEFVNSALKSVNNEENYDNHWYLKTFNEGESDEYTGLYNDDSGGETLIFFENSNSEYEITTNVKLDYNSDEENDTLNGYGIVFESSINTDNEIYNSEDTGYIFQFDAGYKKFLFRERIDGSEQGIQGEVKPSEVDGLDYNSDTFWEEEHEIKVIVEEIDWDSNHKKATAYVDGYEVSSITINALVDSAEGYMGYRGWNDDETTVSDIKIEKLD